MKIVHAYPPNIDAIDAVFNVKKVKGMLYTWGETLYVPGKKVVVTAELRAHEGVHYSRQTNHPPAIEAWWAKYLVDPEFRLAEEKPAHRAEYKAFCGRVRDFRARQAFLLELAARLASPIYGGITTPADAKRFIAEAR